MAKIGYFSGDPREVMNAPVDIVQAALDYEQFEDDYEKAYIQLNKKE